MNGRKPEIIQIRRYRRSAETAQVNLSKRQQAALYARQQDPDRYWLLTRKSTSSLWYCSKLVWRSAKTGYGVDMDSDGGWYVFPGDLRGHVQYMPVLYDYQR